MKTNYLLKPKPKKNPSVRRALTSVLVLVGILAVLFFLGSNSLYSILGPVARLFWQGREWVSRVVEDGMEFFISKESLISENRTLRQEVINLSALSFDVDRLRAENEELRNIRGEGAGEVGRVLSVPSQSFYDIVSVELGPDSSVAPGTRVFARGNVALGEVVERSGRIAKVSFFSGAGVVTLSQLQKDGTTISLSGQGGGAFVAEVPRSLDVSVGDIVVLPAYSGGIIGRVGAVEEARTDSFKNVYVHYPFSVFSLGWVRFDNAFQ